MISQHGDTKVKQADMEKYSQFVHIKINVYTSLIRGESFVNRPITHTQHCRVLTYIFVYKEYIAAFELHV